TVAYLDARRLGVDGIVQAVRSKLDGRPPIAETLITRVPRTEAEQQQVLLARPDGWEFLYFASELLRGRDNLESKYRHHELRYAPRSGGHLRREDIPTFMAQASDDIQRTIAQLMQLLERDTQHRALGARGEEGNPSRIFHLARRMTDLYEEILDWASRI